MRSCQHTKDTIEARGVIHAVCVINKAKVTNPRFSRAIITVMPCVGELTAPGTPVAYSPSIGDLTSAKSVIYLNMQRKEIMAAARTQKSNASCITNKRGKARHAKRQGAKRVRQQLQQRLKKEL